MVTLTVIGLVLALVALVGIWGWLCYDSTKGILNLCCNLWTMEQIGKLIGVVLVALVETLNQK